MQFEKIMNKVETNTGMKEAQVLNGKTVTLVGVTSNPDQNIDAKPTVPELPRIEGHRRKFKKIATKKEHKHLNFDKSKIEKHIGIVCIYCWCPVGMLLQLSFQRIIEHKGGLVCHDSQILGGKTGKRIFLLIWSMQTCVFLDVIPARVHQVIEKCQPKFKSYTVGLLGTPVQL